MERHRLLQNVETGVFKDQIMRRFSKDIESQVYTEITWDEKVMTIREGNSRFTKELNFGNTDGCSPGNATISGGPANSFCSFFLF